MYKRLLILVLVAAAILAIQSWRWSPYPSESSRAPRTPAIAEPIWPYESDPLLDRNIAALDLAALPPKQAILEIVKSLGLNLCLTWLSDDDEQIAPPKASSTTTTTTTIPSAASEYHFRNVPLRAALNTVSERAGR